MKLIKSMIIFVAFLSMAPGILILILASALGPSTTPEESKKIEEVLENAISELNKIKAN